ncbi:MAG: EI24 domain-containing protein [Planctomycetes bacterium]|nr:EI24 domain-containing protein [Planctomycetota bacterium]
MSEDVPPQSPSETDPPGTSDEAEEEQASEATPETPDSAKKEQAGETTPETPDSAKKEQAGTTPETPDSAKKEQAGTTPAALSPIEQDFTTAPEDWLPYSGKLGERCNTCGDLRSSPAGCPACCSELADLKEGLAERIQIKARGYAPGEFMRGAGYLPRGAWFLLRNPKLWKFAVVPLVINMIVALLGLWGAIYLVQHADTIANNAMADWTGVWEYVGNVLRFLLRLFEFFAVLVVPILLAWLLTAFPLGILYKLLFTPFMEALGGATDRALLTNGQDRVEFQTSHLTIAWAMLDAVLLGLLQGVVILLLLPILFVPVVGSLVWMILPPSIFASMDFSDIHLVRRGYAPGEKLRLWKTHKWRFFGYGASFFFFLTLPVLNALAIPVATVGGAMLYLELDRK